MISSFLEWSKVDCYLTFHNKQSDESLEILSAKRGNESYAKNKRKMAWQINNGLSQMQFDFSVINSREIVRDTHLFLVTLTFDPKLVSKEEAWHLLSSKGKALNRFSANLSKIFGTKATWKVKEANSSGYPAPHILVMVDKPIRAFRYRGKWRIQSNRILERLRGVWKYGFIDFQAIVGGKINKRGVVSYLTKYMTKSINVPRNNMGDFETKDLKNEKTAIFTHAWNKIYRMRDVLSKSLKMRLNRVYIPTKDVQKISEWTVADIRWDVPLEMIRRKSFVPHNPSKAVGLPVFHNTDRS